MSKKWPNTGLKCCSICCKIFNVFDHFVDTSRYRINTRVTKTFLESSPELKKMRRAALCNLLKFAQFKKCENTYGGVIVLVPLQLATLKTLPLCSSCFLNGTNGTKLRKASQILIKEMPFCKLIQKRYIYEGKLQKF